MSPPALKRSKVGQTACYLHRSYHVLSTRRWRHDDLSGDVTGEAIDRAMMLLHRRPQSIAEVAQHVPTIRDLNGSRGTRPGAVGVSAGTVADNDFDTLMPAEPGGEGFRLPV